MNGPYKSPNNHHGVGAQIVQNSCFPNILMSRLIIFVYKFIFPILLPTTNITSNYSHSKLFFPIFNPSLFRLMWSTWWHEILIHSIIHKVHIKPILCNLNLKGTWSMFTSMIEEIFEQKRLSSYCLQVQLVTCWHPLVFFMMWDGLWCELLICVQLQGSRWFSLLGGFPLVILLLLALYSLD